MGKVLFNERNVKYKAKEIQKEQKSFPLPLFLKQLLHCSNVEPF